MNLPVLKWQLIMLFNLESNWESQILTQITAKLELEEVLIMHSLEENLTSLKICDFLSTSSTSWEVMDSLVISEKYKRFKIKI